MGFLDDLKESLTPRPNRNEPPPEPYITAPSREPLQQGDNEIILIRVPYPTEGSATVDYSIQLMRPIDGIFYPVIMNGGSPPLAAYSFGPQGINLSQPVSANLNNPFFDLVPGQLARWKKEFDKIYVSVNGQGTGGFITLLGCRGLMDLTSNPAANTELVKQTIIETTTPLAANGVFTGAWHDSQADGVLYVTATVFASQNSAANGFVIQESDDISNANLIRTIQVGNSVANAIGRITTAIKCRYWRVVFTNTTTAQTAMELTTTASDILNQNNYAGDTVDVNVPVQAIAFPTPISSITDNAVSNNFVPITEINAGTTASAPTEAFVPIYGGAFSGTANAALQGWSRPRTPTVFKQATATALGATALWTPGAGNKFRILKFKIQVTADATLAAAGEQVIELTDAATVLPLTHIVWIPAAAGAVLNDEYDSGWIDLGQFGILSAAANNVLNINLGTALATGKVNVIVCGTEE
jgi:hypothetical protein